MASKKLKELKERVRQLEELEREISDYEEFVDVYEARPDHVMYATNNIEEYRLTIPLPEEFKLEVLKMAKEKLEELKKNYDDYLNRETTTINVYMK